MARFMGLFPTNNSILATYNASLANEISRDIRNIVKSEEYQDIFDLRLSKESSSVETWKFEGYGGKFNACGILGGMTGKGYHLGIIDDPFKNREEAESEVIRSKVWSEFTDSFLTRRAPVSITIVCMTPWHIDDLSGRIKLKMDADKNFPRFEFLKFPAKSEDYEGGYLFLERFSKEWYLSQFASLGTYSAAGLLQCSPIVRGGKIIKTDKIQFVDEMPKGLKWLRAWDLALSEKETIKDDPDYTAGVLMAVYREKVFNNFYQDQIFIRDVIRIQKNSADRDRVILETAKKDGQEVKIYVEYTGLFKDSYKHLTEVLRGVRIISKVSPNKDLVVRVSKIEPIFEAGNVYVLKADWNHEFVKELADFTGSKSMHDDQVAALITGYEGSKKGAASVAVIKGIKK